MGLHIHIPHIDLLNHGKIDQRIGEKYRLSEMLTHLTQCHWVFMVEAWITSESESILNNDKHLRGNERSKGRKIRNQFCDNGVNLICMQTKHFKRYAMLDRLSFLKVHDYHHIHLAARNNLNYFICVFILTKKIHISTLQQINLLIPCCTTKFGALYIYIYIC